MTASIVLALPYYEAHYRAFDGLDEADAAELGLSLARISPPPCEDGRLPQPSTMQLPRPDSDFSNV